MCHQRRPLFLQHLFRGKRCRPCYSCRCLYSRLPSTPRSIITCTDLFTGKNKKRLYQRADTKRKDPAMTTEKIKEFITQFQPSATFDETGEWLNILIDAADWKPLAIQLRNEPNGYDYLF